MRVPFKWNRSTWSISWNRVWGGCRGRTAGVITKRPPSKSDGENQFLRKLPRNFIFERMEISHRKSVDGNRWEAEPKPNLTKQFEHQLACRPTSRWNEQKRVMKVAIKQNTIKDKPNKLKKRGKRNNGCVTVTVYAEEFSMWKKPDSWGILATPIRVHTMRNTTSII